MAKKWSSRAATFVLKLALVQEARSSRTFQECHHRRHRRRHRHRLSLYRALVCFTPLTRTTADAYPSLLASSPCPTDPFRYGGAAPGSNMNMYANGSPGVHGGGVGGGVGRGGAFIEEDRSVRLLFMESLKDCKDNANLLAGIQPTKAKEDAIQAESGDDGAGDNGSGGSGNGGGGGGGGGGAKKSDAEKDSGVTLLHVSRPLVGGVVAAPDETEALNAQAVRSMLAVLRSFPEMEGIFRAIDSFVVEVNYVGFYSADGFNRIEPSLETCIARKWQTFVEAVDRACAVSTHNTSMSAIMPWTSTATRVRAQNQAYSELATLRAAIPTLVESYIMERSAPHT